MGAQFVIIAGVVRPSFWLAGTFYLICLSGCKLLGVNFFNNGHGKRKRNMSDHLMEQESYDPNKLLDALIEKLGLKNDAALSRALEVAPPVISKVRHRRLPVGASLLIRMHEETGMNVKELRALMGDQRARFRINEEEFADDKHPPVAPTA